MVVICYLVGKQISTWTSRAGIAILSGIRIKNLWTKFVLHFVLTGQTIQTIAKLTPTSANASVRDGAVRSSLCDHKSKPMLESKSDYLG